jgi:hypothetical protein
MPTQAFEDEEGRKVGLWDDHTVCVSPHFSSLTSEQISLDVCINFITHNDTPLPYFPNFVQLERVLWMCCLGLQDSRVEVRSEC